MIIECPSCSCHYTGDNLQHNVVSAAQSQSGTLNVICPKCEQWLGLPQYRAILTQPVSDDEQAKTKSLYWEVATASEPVTGPLQISFPQPSAQQGESIFDGLDTGSSSTPATSSGYGSPNYGSSGYGSGSVFDGYDQGTPYDKETAYDQGAGYDPGGGYYGASPQGEGAQTKHIIMIVGGLLGLITMCVVGALFLPGLLFKEDPIVAKNTGPKRNNSRTITPPNRNLPAVRSSSHEKPIDELITDLKSGDSRLVDDAMSQFSFSRSLDKAKRKDVAAALQAHFVREGYLHQSRIDDDTVRAMQKWVGTENITWLNTAIKEASNDRVRKQLVSILIKTDDPSAAPGLAADFSNYEVQKAFKKFGPGTAKFVLPYLNHPDYSTRTAVRKMANDWGLENETVVQCITDLAGATELAELSEKAKAVLALEWIADWDGELTEPNRLQLALALEKILEQSPESTSEDVYKSLGRWGRVPESADKLVSVLATTDNYSAKRYIVSALKSLKSDSTLPTLVTLLDDSSISRTVTEVIKELNPELVAKAMLPEFNSNDRNTRDLVRNMLKDMLVEKSLVLSQCVEDLKTMPSNELEPVLDWLVKQELDEEHRDTVAGGLNAALVKMKSVVIDEDAIVDVLKVAKVWGNFESAQVIAPLLSNSRDRRIIDAAIDALAEIKSPDTFVTIAGGLKGDSSTRHRVKAALITIGTDAESVVLPYVRDTDRQVRSTAYEILGEIGGLEASRVLASRIEIATRTNELSDKMTAKRAFDAIIARGIDVEEVGRPDGPVLRDWTDSTGEKTIHGKMLGFESGELQLEVDGETFTMKMSRLSKEDQNYARDELRRRRNAERAVDDE